MCDHQNLFRLNIVIPMRSVKVKLVEQVVIEVQTPEEKPWTWSPPTEIVNGRPFISLQKWDAKFVRFVTGKSL